MELYFLAAMWSSRPFTKLVPFAVQCTHEIPLYKRTFVFGILSLQLPACTNGWGVSFCTAWQLPSALPTFSHAFLVSWYSLSSGSINHIPLFLRAFSNFGASFAQLLSFSPLRCSAEIGPYLCHSWSRLVVVWNTCQSLPGPLWSFGRFLFQQSNFCETSPWIWETSLRNSKNHRCVLLGWGPDYCE